jgi:tRNA A-37 threonylcarbamoyl transferase component Bud32
MENLSGNSISQVWIDGEFVFKSSPKHLMDNENYALGILRKSGHVPKYERVEDELIKMELLTPDPPGAWQSHKMNDAAEHFFLILENNELRHGDLTSKHLFFTQGTLKVIDWGESRLYFDPRPDKRREGDHYWLFRSVREIVNAHQCTQ